ncbi:MAG: rhodanese-like domain-containing protein [Gemmatimonadetes bacterium]|nr:rhodanese-like domain-containing protein [Gemmatimonadota bacterium]NIQ52513.1 rhodanese-like domain-containing protein [Gemmatimonadota bacterium]NIU72650.1 rhodanese-like domain-containing protein [Gammaproteobacteria bacterium]NIX43052.1 rhodanese-like domain-containing protein [Gemmatimonadota bacterium]NIY07225.1 rhodanese-like domain-containing protein [Gemmatimonadota bacterium]
MKHWLIITLALGLATGCSTEAPDGARGEAASGAVATETAAESEVVYVDVRTPEEYAAGHVEGAINIPHTEMRERYGELEQYRGDEIVVYCRSGRRSGIAQGILEGVGFDNVENGGGLGDLRARGVPTTE